MNEQFNQMMDDSREPFRCPHCGYENVSDTAYCLNCQQTLVEPPAVEEPVLATCWRCQKPNELSAQQCRYCDATLREETPETKREKQLSQNNGLVAMIGFYALSLLLLLINGWMLQFGVHRAGGNDAELFREAIPVLLFTDALFLGLVIVSWLVLRRPARQPKGKSPIIGWLLGFPLLAGVLAINLGYHWWLKQLFKLEDLQLPFWNSDLWPWTVLIICIQPAVTEELFFRQVVFGVLQRNMSFHGAVWVSALIFALAHLGGVLSIPTLMLGGALFAYLRAATGSLLLPMILHFTHNLVVVMI